MGQTGAGTGTWNDTVEVNEPLASLKPGVMEDVCRMLSEAMAYEGPNRVTQSIR